MDDTTFMTSIARTALGSANAGYAAGMRVGEQDAARRLRRLIQAVQSTVAFMAEPENAVDAESCVGCAMEQLTAALAECQKL